MDKSRSIRDFKFTGDWLQMCQGTWSPIRGNGLCPRKYGTTVDLSGRFPSERLRDNGSNGAGISADAKAVFINWLLQYDTTWYIYVRTKANEMASLVQRTAQKQKNTEKLKTTRTHQEMR